MQAFFSLLQCGAQEAPTLVPGGAERHRLRRHRPRRGAVQVDAADRGRNQGLHRIIVLSEICRGNCQLHAKISQMSIRYALQAEYGLGKDHVNFSRALVQEFHDDFRQGKFGQSLKTKKCSIS